jgi:RNA polymerase sigma-70 factor (ECF subfamily)
MSRRKSKFAPAQMLSIDDLMPKDADVLLAGAKSGELTPEDIALQHELRGRTQEAIVALPKHYRLVLILRDMEQLETREVAEVMGITEQAAKVRLHRARATVRKKLAGYAREMAREKSKAHA